MIARMLKLKIFNETSCDLFIVICLLLLIVFYLFLVLFLYFQACTNNINEMYFIYVICHRKLDRKYLYNVSCSNARLIDMCFSRERCIDQRGIQNLQQDHGQA